jgi:pimeloyl-ACP methyl ester carboxylesterase
MLLTTGLQEITLNRNKKHWNEIVSYCNEHPGNFSYDESVQLETYATDAENYISEVPKVNLWSVISKNAIKYHWPLTSMFVNYRYSSNAKFNKDLGKMEFSSSLNKVKTPVLILYGFYDFICPKGLGEDLLNKIGSQDKKMVISPISGHSMMFQDEALFCSAVDSFINLHR